MREVSTENLSCVFTEPTTMSFVLILITQHAHDCDMVVVHDDDLARIRGDHQPDALMSHLQSTKPVIHKVLCGQCQCLPISQLPGFTARMFAQKISRQLMRARVLQLPSRQQRSPMRFRNELHAPPPLRMFGLSVSGDQDMGRQGDG